MGKPRSLSSRDWPVKITRDFGVKERAAPSLWLGLLHWVGSFSQGLWDRLCPGELSTLKGPRNGESHTAEY